MNSGSNRGQSTLEFVLTLILLMGFVLFYARLSYFLGYANLVQYATFMAARAYQSSAPDQEQQVTAASNVIIDLLKKSRGLQGEERFGIAQAVGGGSPSGARIGAADNFLATDDSLSWLQGVRYSFRGQLFVSLFGSRPTPASVNPGSKPGEVRLTSESWLGREPTEEECRSELGSRNPNFGGQRVEVTPDNGC